MMSSLAFVSLLRGVLFMFALHPLHISVTEIEFDEKEKELEIVMRVFADDLELTMRRQQGKTDLDILNLKKDELNQMMSPYLYSHLKITVDGKPQKLEYLGNELEGDAFIFYIAVRNIKKLKTIEIHNDVIMDTFDDQSNLVHVTVREKIKSLRLTSDVRAGKLTFE